MSTKTAVLAVRIVTDAKAGKAGIDDYGTSVEGLKKKLDGLTIPAAAALGAIALLTKGALDKAAELQTAGQSVETVFGNQAEAVKAASEAAIKSTGQSSSAYQQMAAIIGEQLKNVGTSQADLVPTTKQIIARGADLAKVYGGTAADAVDAFGKALKGTTKGLAKYGVEITAGEIKAQLAADGNAKLTGTALKNATAQATLKIAFNQTSNAAGKYADSSGTAATVQQNLNAQWDDAQEKLGTALLPYLSQAAGLLSDVAGFVQENSDVVVPLVGTIAAFAGGILILNGALTAYETVAGIATAAQTALDVALDANPISLIIIAIALLIAIIILWATNWDKLTAAVGRAWDAIIGGAQAAIKWLKDAFGWIGKVFGGGGIGFNPVGGAVGGGDDPFFPDPEAGGGTGGWPDFPAGLGSSGGLGGGPVTNNYWTVNGAIDPAGTARTIKSVVDRDGKNTGTLTVGSAKFLG
jgi:uncharacterized protein YoxC